MTQDEIIEMAKQAGISEDHARGMTIFLETFANLIAKYEREECAKLRQMLTPFDLHKRSEMLGVMNQALDDYQQLIRARGQE
jgi:hypothetical protein